MKKNCKKRKKNQNEFRIEKITKRKADKFYVKWKRYDNLFNSWINKKGICIKTIQYFPKLLRGFGGNINVKVDL